MVLKVVLPIKEILLAALRGRQQILQFLEKLNIRLIYLHYTYRTNNK